MFFLKKLLHTNLIQNADHGGVYSIQHCAIKFDSDLEQVDGFLWILRFPPPINLTASI
jgi:hypothetical protein